MIGKLVLGTTKTSAIPVVLKETGPELYVEKAINGQGKVVNSGSSVINTSNATTLGAYCLPYAYYQNQNLTGAVDFHTIQTIETYALQYTFLQTRITSVDLNSLTTISGAYACAHAFRNCDYLTSVDLSSLTTINGDYSCYSMFYDSDHITEIDLSSLTTLSGPYCCAYMFYSCNSLEDVDLSGITSITPTYTFQYAFAECQSLETVDLSSLTTISGNNCCQYMFQNCTKLETVKLDSLPCIGDKTTGSGSCCSNMFQNCTGLTSIDLSGVKSISGQYACQNMFRGCTSLVSVDLSNLYDFRRYESTTSNSDSCQYMFYGCTALKNVNISKIENFTYSYSNSSSSGYYWGNPGSYMFSNSGIESNPFINASVVWGTHYCFQNCNSLLDGTFPKLVYICGNGSNPVPMYYCFSSCSNMTKCDFPALQKTYQTNLFNYAFYNCTSLTDIHFPMLTMWNTNNPFGTYSFYTNGTPSITVHFRKDKQADIEALSGFASGWGASSIVFDQIGKITVGGVNYWRMGYCNKPGYIAWVKDGSSITVNNTTYPLAMDRMGYFPGYIVSEERQPGAAFCFYDGTTDIFATTPDVHVGDYVFSNNDKTGTGPDLEVTASTVEIIYTSDSAEPDVGDTAYSDISGTVFGTISAVA